MTDSYIYGTSSAIFHTSIPKERDIPCLLRLFDLTDTLKSFFLLCIGFFHYTYQYTFWTWSEHNWGFSNFLRYSYGLEGRFANLCWRMAEIRHLSFLWNILISIGRLSMFWLIWVITWWLTEVGSWPPGTVGTWCLGESPWWWAKAARSPFSSPWGSWRSMWRNTKRSSWKKIAIVLVVCQKRWDNRYELFSVAKYSVSILLRWKTCFCWLWDTYNKYRKEVLSILKFLHPT